MIQSLAKPDTLEQLAGPAAVRPRPEAHPEQHILDAGVALQQVERLENVADRPCPQAIPPGFAGLGDRAAVQFNAASVRLQNAGNEVEERGFAGATGAAQGRLLPGIERESRYVNHGQNGSARCPEALAQIFDIQQQQREDQVSSFKFQVFIRNKHRARGGAEGRREKF